MCKSFNPGKLAPDLLLKNCNIAVFVIVIKIIMCEELGKIYIFHVVQVCSTRNFIKCDSPFTVNQIIIEENIFFLSHSAIREVALMV